MKTSFIYAYNIFKVTAISTLFLITWLFQFQNVYGAGYPFTRVLFTYHNYDRGLTIDEDPYSFPI